MGNGASREEEESVGYRVLGVQPNSPASLAGLVSFFDFIVAADGVPLRKLDNTFIESIKASEDKPLPITVFNYKSQMARDVSITPSRSWGGQGMLGVTIRFDSYFNAEENLVRVLHCAKGGPAYMAGLTPFSDYLLGTAEKVFNTAETLHEELVKHLDTPMEMCVYSTETDQVRVVVVLPTDGWGGEGCLGAEIGSGYLHALPQNCRSSTGMSVGLGISIGMSPDTTSEPLSPVALDSLEAEGALDAVGPENNAASSAAQAPAPAAPAEEPSPSPLPQAAPAAAAAAAPAEGAEPAAEVAVAGAPPPPQ